MLGSNRIPKQINIGIIFRFQLIKLLRGNDSIGIELLKHFLDILHIGRGNLDRQTILVILPQFVYLSCFHHRIDPVIGLEPL